MTFSNPDVRSLIAAKFLAAFEDTEGSAAAGASFAHAPNDAPASCIRGNGEHNMQMLILTPDGRIVHVVAGFIEGAELVAELRFALASLELLRRSKPEAAAGLLSDRHWQARRQALEAPSTGPFATFIQRRIADDHAFVAEHPLLAVAAFDPERLVGRAKSFFGSSTGKTPERTIGDPRALDAAGRSPVRGATPKDATKPPRPKRPDRRVWI